MAKTNLGLVEYAKSKLTLPTIYMLGGFGRKLTQAMIDRRVKELQCAHTIRNLTTIKAGIGKYCFDCVGLIKGYMWESSPGVVAYNIPAGSDQNVRMMYGSSKEKGNLATMPDIPGLLVFTSDLGHVGVYIGKDSTGKRQYIESTPAWNKWGICQSNDTIRTWAFWGKYHLIDYIVPAKTGGYYEVVRGDTLSRIAGSYGMSWQELYENNKDNIGDNPSSIEVGMILRVPPTNTPQVIIKEVIVEKEVIKEVIVEVEKPINAILNNGQVEVTVKSIVGVK